MLLYLFPPFLLDEMLINCYKNKTYDARRAKQEQFDNISGMNLL